MDVEEDLPELISSDDDDSSDDEDVASPTKPQVSDILDDPSDLQINVRLLACLPVCLVC